MELLSINQINFPSGYNGLEWNTHDPRLPKRKNLQFYLKDNLPDKSLWKLRRYMHKCKWAELPDYRYFEPFINQ